MLLTVDHLRKSYDEGGTALPVLSDVSFSLQAKESLALTGESGSGKSTLLHLIAGLDRPDDGEIAVEGQALSPLADKALAALRRSKIGLVFQQFNLIPSLTVAANLSFHARLAGRQDLAWEAELSERLGLAALLKRYPEQLSGGQQQRVAIGRTLALRPALLLADEPTGNLDEETGARVLDAMLTLVTELGVGLLMVTHSQRVAARLDRRLHLAQGRVA